LAAAAARRPYPARSDVDTADAPCQIDECRRDAALQTALALGCGFSATQRRNLRAVTSKSSTADSRLVEFQTAVNRDSPDDSRTGVNFVYFRPSCNTEARFGRLPSPRAVRTMVLGPIWPFSLAFGRTPPICRS